MFDSTTTLPGPEFLEAVAEAELQAGNVINRREYQRRAREWRDDQIALEQARGENAALQRRLDELRTRVGAALQ